MVPRPPEERQNSFLIAFLSSYLSLPRFSPFFPPSSARIKNVFCKSCSERLTTQEQTPFQIPSTLLDPLEPQVGPQGHKRFGKIQISLYQSNYIFLAQKQNLLRRGVTKKMVNLLTMSQIWSPPLPHRTFQTFLKDGDPPIGSISDIF